MVRQQYRAAFWLLVLVALVTSSLAATAGAQAASSANYTLTGYVEQGNGVSPVPAGVQVDLVSRATGQVFTTTVAAGGVFTFTSSSTGGALVPGYWGVWVPPQGNVSLSGCNPTKPYQCAVLPADQNPVYRFENASALTTSSYPIVLTGVSVAPYTGKVTGTVTSGGTIEPGAQVSLIDPYYNGFSLVNNTTSASGMYTFNAPISTGYAPGGSWVLKTVLPGVPSTLYNYTKATIPTRALTWLNVSVQSYLVSGFVNQSLHPQAHVPTAGNVTIFDPINGYIYSSSTPPGGYYSAGTYPLNFVSGSQTFDVILSSIGYGTVWYPLPVSSPTPVQRNVYVSPLTPSQLGRYGTTLDFSGINVTTGKGNLTVNTTELLGNDSVLPNLPNATVGQLWAQLGLDFNHSASLPRSMLSSVASYVNTSGPFFPAVQAQTAVNGTGFLGPATNQTLWNWTTTCSGYCGLSTSASLTYRWSNSYALNGTLSSNSSSYTISLGFAHPVSSSDSYNYTFVLPKGYVLAAATQAPSGTRLVEGTGGTWTTFTLQSLPSSTLVGSARFTIVKSATLTAIVNATVSNFAFSSKNVLNSTRGNYTVEVGVGQNVTLSAVNSIYPAGTNGTRFAWTFGDGATANVTTATTNHTYAATSVGTELKGSLKVFGSGGTNGTTAFFVWVAKGPVFANISVNSTASQNKTAGTTPYVFVPWGTVLHFNASASSAMVGGGAKAKGVLSVARFTLVSSHGFKQTANYSVGQNVSFGSNFTVQFLGAGNYLSAGTVAGTPVPFSGWQYNLSLTVWSGTGQSSSASLVVLVNDTEKPVAAIRLLNPSGTQITGSGIVVTNSSKLTARVLLSGANASDPHNGSITHYYWLVTNSANSSFHWGNNTTAVKPYPSLWLSASSVAYTINLTVWDKNGNSGYTTTTLTVSQNSTTSPIMAVDDTPGNFSIPTSYTDGSSYTLWVNLTVGGGSKAVAQNVSVSFYTLTSSGGGSPNTIGGSPSSVKFYTYTSGVVNSTPFAFGLIQNLSYNTTVRAEITWTPVITGNYLLYVNVTASNEFPGSYHNGPNLMSVSISIGPNATTQLLEYVAIAVAVVVVIFLLILYYRRRSGKGAAKSGGSVRSGLERTKRSEKEADEEDEDDT